MFDKDVAIPIIRIEVKNKNETKQDVHFLNVKSSGNWKAPRLAHIKYSNNVRDDNIQAALLKNNDTDEPVQFQIQTNDELVITFSRYLDDDGEEGFKIEEEIV